MPFAAFTVGGDDTADSVAWLLAVGLSTPWFELTFSHWCWEGLRGSEWIGRGARRIFLRSTSQWPSRIPVVWFCRMAYVWSGALHGTLGMEMQEVQVHWIDASTSRYACWPVDQHSSCNMLFGRVWEVTGGCISPEAAHPPMNADAVVVAQLGRRW